MLMPSTAAYDAIDAARAFNHFGLELPKDASHWVQRLTELRSNRPEAPPHNAVAKLFADNAKAGDIEKAIAAHLGHSHRRNQHSEAETIAGARALNAIREHRDELHAQLATIAAELIDRLHRAAQISEDIRELSRQRRTAEAHLIATAEDDAAELHDLYEVRNNYLTAPGSHWATGWWDCQTFRNPWDIGAGKSDHDGATLWTAWAASIRAGGTLWFPTFEEATAASQAREPDMTPPIDPRRETATFVG